MANIQRFGSVSKVKPEKLEYYKKLHANPWPQINSMIKECNIQNYSIYYNDGYLFTYFEYIGNDNILDLYIKYLRDKLDKAHERKFIQTVRGIGFIFK